MGDRRLTTYVIAPTYQDRAIEAASPREEIDVTQACRVMYGYVRIAHIGGRSTHVPAGHVGM